MLALVEQVTRRARDKDLSGRRVQVKLRYGDFRTVTRARTRSEMLRVRGVGPKKLDEFGDAFLSAITTHTRG